MTMFLIKVGAATLNQTPLDWDGNRARILGALEQARATGVSILCLPEMCLCGYGCEDMFHAPGVQHRSVELLEELLPATRGMIVSLGLPLWHHNAIFNATGLIADGKVVGFVAKRFLAGEGIHYEPRWFKPWPAGARATTILDGHPYPLGDIFFDAGGVRIGFEICEDAWVAQRPGGEMARKGVDIILNPSASHFAFGKLEIRKRFVIEGSRALSVSYVYANLVGNEAGRAIYDGGVLIATGGKLVAQGPRFSYADWGVTSAVVDVDATRTNQARSGSFQPSVEDKAEDCVAMPFTFPPLEPAPGTDQSATWEHDADVKAEEFARAEALGLFDYMRKSRSRGFVLSLSGGTDSAACAVLIATMVRLGVQELGIEGFARKLSYIEALKNARTPQDLVRQLLVCVYQATRNSSQVTLDAARTVAEATGAEFIRFDVDHLVHAYTDMVSKGIGRTLDWKRDDIALQNIQARARAPGVWMLANIRGALLIATSNRSEAAAGFATMDGDTCGGLSPIAGIDKAYLRQWVRWMETTGPAGLGPEPALKVITAQQPTPELRPPEAGQTSEGDLMPFDLLNAIERAAIRDKQMPLEAFQLLRLQFPQFTPQQLLLWIERFYRLWCRNQWKRERYAPSFHLDDENLDPKTWCRFPILSGGYERELAELREYVASLAK
jgi:NAD+ synthase (glutamine-hydrolysing)